MLKELNESNVCSIFEFLQTNDFTLFLIFLVGIEKWITKFTTHKVFPETIVNEIKAKFFTFSIIHVFFITTLSRWSWILEENTVITMATFVNVSEIISFHFAESGFEYISGCLFFHILKWHNFTAIINIVNEFVKISASLNHIKLTFSNVISKKVLLFLVFEFWISGEGNTNSKLLSWRLNIFLASDSKRIHNFSCDVESILFLC
jgi:hypothetical protein